MSRSDDVRYMTRALALAARAAGETNPNPMVGCVVVKGGRIVGEGFHRRAGGPHAEVVALRAAGAKARGATLYVTLEPCSIVARTPACARTVRDAGVRRVVAAMRDPNPKVDGRGLAQLRRAGVQVDVGVLEDEARRLNKRFVTFMETGRPYLLLKAAMTLDGRIATARGESKWITSPEQRRHARALRRLYDGVLVGIGTVLADDPALTVRLDGPWPRQPLRVVLDSKARTPVTAKLIQGEPKGHAVIAVGADAPEARVRALEEAGASVVRCPGVDGRVAPAELLSALFARDVRGVLVEGGAEVAASFLDAGLVDRVAMFLAPRLLGGVKAPSVLAGAGRELKRAVALDGVEVRRVGDDILVEGDVRRG